MRRLERLLRNLDNAVEVGFFDGHTHPKNDGKHTIAEVAMINEFGLNVPSRPFFRETLIEHNNYLKHLQTASTLILKGKMKAKTALKDIGVAVEDDVKSKIANNDFKANSPATISRKGENDPLSETGVMERDVSHRVK